MSLRLTRMLRLPVHNLVEGPMIATRMSAFFLAILLSGTPVAGVGGGLSGAELKSLLSGKTASCLKIKDSSTCDTYFDAKGEIKRFTPNNGKRRTGTWSASDADGLCVHWAGRKKRICFVVLKAADGYRLMRKGKHKSTMTAFADGNMLGW